MSSSTVRSSIVRGSWLRSPRIVSILLFVASSSIVSGTPINTREDRAASTKVFDQRQQGTTNIQAHLDNIVVFFIPNNRLSITDYAAKSEPVALLPTQNKLLQTLAELKSHHQSSINDPSSVVGSQQSSEFLNSIPESKSKPESGDKVDGEESAESSEESAVDEAEEKSGAASSQSVHVAQIASIPINPASIQLTPSQSETLKPRPLAPSNPVPFHNNAPATEQERKQENAPAATKPVHQATDGAAKKFPFLIDTPLEIPVVVIQDPIQDP